MRLIDADKLPLDIEHEDVDDAPTIDAVEVVRCKDCKWWINGMCYSDNFILRFEEVKPDWFCADGERKDDADRVGRC